MLRKRQSYKVGIIALALHMKTLVLRGANKITQNPRAHSMRDFSLFGQGRRMLSQDIMIGKV